MIEAATTLTAVGVVATFSMGFVQHQIEQRPPVERSEVIDTITDRDIVEASGLVKLPVGFVTTNDSGDTGRLFVLDESGVTIGVTSWDDNPDDVEALDPAGDSAVWVGDLGDNQRKRKTVEVTRVPVGPGTRTVDEETIDLTYPDGPRDAEALLCDPTDGRLYIATKDVFGGGLYRAPAKLKDDGKNVLELVAPVRGMITDGVFFSDGRHIVLRDYQRAYVYEFPSLERVGEFKLPRQPQGETIAVSDEGELFTLSEGINQKLYRVRLPRRLVAAMAEPTPTPSVSASPPETAETSPSQPGAAKADQADQTAGGRTGWVGPALLATLAASAVGAWLMGRRTRR